MENVVFPVAGFYFSGLLIVFTALVPICKMSKQPCEHIAVEIKFTKQQTIEQTLFLPTSQIFENRVFIFWKNSL